MDKYHIKGAMDRAKGAVKDVAGRASGNTKLRVEGKIDRLKGSVESAVGDAKDAMRKMQKRP